MDVNNGFGPIFDKRGNRSQILSIVLFVLVFSFTHIQGYLNFNLIFPALAACILGEFTRRICLFFEEIFHIKTRYRGRIEQALMSSFFQPNWYTLLVAFGASACISVLLWFQNGISAATNQNFLILVFLIPLISNILGVRENTEAELSKITENATGSVAEGLAWSFYFGYLKLILPSIRETINLTDNEVDDMALRDHIRDHKVFIVIPKDCNCFQNFTDADPNIQFISQTHEQRISRAGVQLRVYKHSIYRVRSRNETFYCLMEYATPLLSMFEMEREQRCNFIAADKDIQVVLFYKKLKEILESDEACLGRYHLVLTSNAENLAEVMANEITLSRQETM